MSLLSYVKLNLNYMRTTDSFPFHIDGLFAEFRQASAFVIDYRGYPCEPGEVNVTDFAIISVNGFKTPREFNNYWKSLCEELRRKAMEISGTLLPEDRPLFLGEVVKELKTYLKLVFNDTYFRSILNSRIIRPFSVWVFDRPEFTGDKYHGNPYNRDTYILRKAWKFTVCFRDQITELIKNISNLASVADFLPVTQLTQELNETILKITLGITSSQFACFVRVVFESGVIEHKNKSELCRRFTNFFSTKQKDNLSYKNFRNHFDNPTRDDLLLLASRLQGLMKCVNNLLRNTDN